MQNFFEVVGDLHLTFPNGLDHTTQSIEVIDEETRSERGSGSHAIFLLFVLISLKGKRSNDKLFARMVVVIWPKNFQT
jgi:hypothetical protein